MSVGYKESPAGVDTARAARLIEQLAATERELRDLLGGDAEFVITARGEAYLLHSAQESLRHNAEAQSLVLEATRAAEQRFRALVESAADLILLLDEDGRILYASPPTAGALGYDLETEFIGRTAWDFLHPDDRPLVAARMIHAGARARTAFRVCRKDRVWRRFEGVFTNRLDDPAVRAVVLNCRDVTEREEMHEKLERLFELSEDLICTAGWDGRLHNVNPAFERVLGYRPEELMAAPFADFVHPEDRERTARTFANMTEGRPVSAFTNRYRHKDGSYRFLQWNTVPVPEEKIAYAVARDVTEQRTAEESIRRQAHMLDHVGQAVIATDPGGCVVYANRFAGELYGWQPAEMLGRDILEVIVPRTSRAQAGKILAAMRKGKNWSGEFLVQNRKGRVFPTFVTDSPLLDDQGRLAGIIGISTDISARKKAEEDLRKKDALIRIASKLTRTGGWILEMPGRQLSWSDEIFDLLGYPRAASPPLEAALGLHPETWQERVTAAVEACMRDGTPFDMEVPIFAAGRRIVWGRVCAEAERGADGTITRVQGAFQDISERRRADAALREAQEKYQAIFNNASEGIFQTTPEGVFLAANPAMARILGYGSPEELIRERIDIGGQGYVDPARRQEFQREIEEKGVVSNFEYEVRRKDGSIICVSENVRRIRSLAGRTVYYEGSLQDITKRKATEDALNKSVREQRQLTAQLESERARLVEAQAVAKVGSWETTLSTMAVVWSAETYRIFGVDPARFQPTHQSFLELVHPEDCAAVDQAFVQSIESGQPSVMEHRLITPGGQVKFVEERWQVFRDWQAKPSRAVGTCQDITERKQAEAVLEGAQRRLVEASRHAGKAEVATNVLHNVGNVLNSVNISADQLAGPLQNSAAEKLARVSEMLAERKDDLAAYFSEDPQGVQIPHYLGLLAKSLRDNHASAQTELAALRRNIEHIRQIIAVQQDHGRPDISETISASEVLEDALRINAATMERHHIRVVREYEEGVTLVADKHQILQILVNLVHNAISALDQMPLADRRLTARLERVGEAALRYSVIDNGAGVAPEHLGRLFEHGFTTRPHGHGFGLHSAALLARELGGSLQVASPGPGGGAVFTLEVPLRPPARA